MTYTKQRYRRDIKRDTQIFMGDSFCRECCQAIKTIPLIEGCGLGRRLGHHMQCIMRKTESLNRLQLTNNVTNMPTRYLLDPKGYSIMATQMTRIRSDQ